MTGYDKELQIPTLPEDGCMSYSQKHALFLLGGQDNLWRIS